MTRRLILSYLAVTLVVLALFEIPLAVFYQQRELDRLTVDTERDATVLATVFEDALEDGYLPDPQPAELYFEDTGVRTVVVDVDGRAIVDTGNEVGRDFSTRPEIITALGGGRTSGTRFSETLNTDLLYVAVPVASGGEVHGALRLTLDPDEVNERIVRFWLGLAVVGGIVLIVMTGIATVIARSVTRSLRRLQSAADRYSLGDLTPAAVEERAPAEFVALESAMNNMARRLDGVLERQRAFVADASHQLRTPLTALRLRLENVQPTVPAAERRDVDAAIDETVRLSQLVDDLLQLARTEQKAQVTSIDLAAVVRERADTWSATAEHGGVALVVDVPDDPVFAYAVDGGIEQVLDNVLDNAVRAAPDGSAVEIVLRQGGARHKLTIADQGPGIDDADKARALQRFWRADTDSSGTGLGLAICEAIVDASGGELGLTDNQPSGLVVNIALNASPSPGRSVNTVQQSVNLEPKSEVGS